MLTWPFLYFVLGDHSEPLIVQHWRSGNKRGPHCCCHWWGIVVRDCLSPVPSHREGTLDAVAPQEFALLTKGRNWTLLYQSVHFTAQASQPWEIWGSVYTAAYWPGSKANTLYGFGRRWYDRGTLLIHWRGTPCHNPMRKTNSPHMRCVSHCSATIQNRSELG